MVEIHWTHHVLGWEMAQILWVGRDHSLSILKLEFWTHSETFESVLATDAIIYFSATSKSMDAIPSAGIGKRNTIR